MKTSFPARPLSAGIRRALLCSALLGPAFIVPMASAEQAVTRQYQIAEGDLGQALTRFAAEAGIVLSFDPGLTRGKRSFGLQGSFNPEDGMHQLLNGSGLQMLKTDDGRYMLMEASEVTDALELGATSITSNTDSSGQVAGSYAARVVTIGKMEQAQKDIPQSVTVVTRQRMDDQDLKTFDQVIMQTPGISRQFVNSGQSGYFARGFALTKVLLDGIDSSTNFGTILGQSPDIATIENVEVLRGAPGLLFGAGEPSGVVNLVRKRPKKQSELNITARAGSWDYYRGEVDLTGSLNETGTLRGRTVVAYEDRDYFYDRSHQDMPLFYGVVDADLDDHTTLMLGYRHQNYRESRSHVYVGLPKASDGSDLALPRSTNVSPAWSTYQSRADEVFAELRHAFSDNWSAKLAADIQRGDIYESGLNRGRLVDITTNQISVRDALRKNYDLNRHGVDLSTEGRFSLFGLEQKISFGINHQQDKRDDTTQTVAYTNLLSLSDLPNIPKPDFSSAPHQKSALYYENYGGYGNLVLNPVDRLKVILGGRLSWYKSEFYSGGTLLSESRQDKELTPYGGVVYELTPEWSAYASYTDIFTVQSASLTASGKSLDPAIGSNYEVGLKGELFDGRMTASAAVFRILQNNRSAIDPDYPSGGCPGANGDYCYINAGKVESKGIELELNGELAPGWQAFAGYTYNKAVYLKDRDANGNPSAKEGGQLGDVTPRHILRTFTSYELPGQWSRFTLGAGVSVQSKLDGTDYDRLPNHQAGRAVWDAFSKYKIDDSWTVSANLNNVFDKTYYNDEYGYRYGEPRNVMFTLRGNFTQF